MKYRKKPVVIEAFRLGIDAPLDWFVDAVKREVASAYSIVKGGEIFTIALINTLEGAHYANHGDYIIRGVNGELYPCKPDIFEMTYEEVQ